MEFRAIAREGGDPLAEKRRRNASAPTFSEAAEAVHKARLSAWKNKKHANQWINTVNQYAASVVGDVRIDQIATPDILKVLGPVWLTKPETARRLKQRLSAIFDWARAAGHIEGENPVDGVAKGLPKQPDRKSHHSAVPIDQVPELVTRLRSGNPDNATALALEFLILTATRTNEIIGAQWKEIDFNSAVWVIPANRMKTGVEHRVPLSDRCIEILIIAMDRLPKSEFVFPGAKEGKPLSNMALLMTMRRMDRKETVHGFRSTFRDWAAERTGFPNEVCEMALAHTVKNKAEAAYRRGDLFEKRRKLMQAWSAYISNPGGKIIRMPSVA